MNYIFQSSAAKFHLKLHLNYVYFELNMSLELNLFVKIFKLGVDLAEICSGFVTSLFQIFLAWCNLRTCRGLGTDLANWYAKSVPTTFCLVKSLHLAWTWHWFCPFLCQVCANSVPNTSYTIHFLSLVWVWHRFGLFLYQTFLPSIICTLGVDLGQIHHYVVQSLPQKR